jgi:hypothetical protein
MKNTILTYINETLSHMSVFSRYPINLYALNLQMYFHRFHPDPEHPLRFPRKEAEIPFGLSSDIPEVQKVIDEINNRK